MPKTTLIATCSMRDGEPDLDIYQARSKAEAKRFVKEFNTDQMEITAIQGGYPGYALVVKKKDAEMADQWLKEHHDLLADLKAVPTD